jgi:hypothetical protein
MGNHFSRAQQSLPIWMPAEAARKSHRPENLYRLLMV